jgi:hypothetical protein
MNLTQMFNRAKSGSYFSRSTDEVWNAINEGSRRAFQAILKEYKGTFIVFDTTSMTLVPNTITYALPAACEQILRIREQMAGSPANSAWHIIRNQSLTSEAMQRDTLLAGNNYVSWDCPDSVFSFYGPYEDMTVADDSGDDETQKIRIAPTPSDTRNVELAFIAKFIEVATVNDNYIIPDEARGYVLDFAIAELLALNGDDRAPGFYSKAEEKLTYYLTLLRDRQVQDPRTVQPYIEDMD